MKALIFGINGQDGYYLEQLLIKNNCVVIGVSKSSGAGISDYATVLKLISEQMPEFIFHLAANSSTEHEFLWENYQTINTGTLNILEAVKNSSPDSKVFISGSGLQFRNDGLPINEKQDFEARDVYSLARIQSVYSARYYRNLGIKTYIGYFFNHDSPLRAERHMTKKISEAAKRISAGSQEKLEIGDLGAIKEYSFAGDIVKAVWTLVNQDNVSEAVIGSGKGYTIEEWADACFSLVGKKWNDHIIPKPGFISGYQKLVSDPTLILSLGWKPETSFDELAKMMMQ